MNYPIWELLTLGGPSLIALISVVHVYIAHLAVGGGLFIWLTDLKGFRESNPLVHSYVRKYTWFFLLLTMVLGGVSGVGIWFVISLVNPAATSKLIHNFVFGWAIEWVFFVGEIVSLLVYHYQFDRLGRKARLNLAFLYFLFAWLSLFVINGIIAFMLTPGRWLETGNFWDGFFNPTFYSSLFFRTFIAFMFAGLFGYVTTVFLKPDSFRQQMIRSCTRWLLYPMIGLALSGLWYYKAVPPEIRRVAFGLNPETAVYVQILLVCSALIFVLGVLLASLARPVMQKALSFVLVAVGLFWMGGFEYTREIARKPYVISGYMYSNSILASDTEQLDSQGMLASAKWTGITEITPENRLEAGRELFNLQCLACHTVGGIKMDIIPLTREFPYLGMLAQLTGQGKINSYMPPFVGTLKEKEALAAYLAYGINQKQPPDEQDKSSLVRTDQQEVPKFDPQKDEYVLLAWNDLGMHCVSDCDPWFSFLPPANTLEAVLIKRGPAPQLISRGVEITYQAPREHENPSAHVRFWEFSETIYGVKLERNVGLGGKGLSGRFDYDTGQEIFIAPMIPVVPYRDDGGYNSYPVFTVQARDSLSGKLLAGTKVVVPVSTDQECYRCHGGEPSRQGAAGISDQTAANILQTHDRLSGTSLYSEALKGRPKLCQSCHADPVLQTEGEPDALNFSASIHGWHANYMTGLDLDACSVCHPDNPKGVTRCFRGIHFTMGLSCTDCHGGMEDLALSLLNGQKDKPAAARLSRHLKPVKAKKVEDIRPRVPWLIEPDCFGCHVDFQPPEVADAFNKWNTEPRRLFRNNRDNALIRCAACHNPPHVIHPAENPFAPGLDQLQPRQYSGMPYAIGANKSCAVCHVVEMKQPPIHHDNMWRMVRTEIE